MFSSTSGSPRDGDEASHLEHSSQTHDLHDDSASDPFNRPGSPDPYNFAHLPSNRDPFAAPPHPDTSSAPLSPFSPTPSTPPQPQSSSSTSTPNTKITPITSTTPSQTSPNPPSVHPSVSIPPVNDPPPPLEGKHDNSSAVMKVGTLIVIGAMAANVIGFRHSRWAVGKDIHRAWQNYERRQQSRPSSSSSSSRKHNSSSSFSSSHRTTSNSNARRRSSMAEEAARRATAEAAARAARAARATADRTARGRTRSQHDGWEASFRSSRGPDFEFRQTGFRMDVDPRILEQMMRARTGGNGSPFGLPADVLQELLRAARAAEQAQSGRARTERGTGGPTMDFDPFKFWERMGEAEWRDFEREMGSGGGGGGGRAGFGGDGVFTRAGLSRHYATLGLREGASQMEVKTAYRKEAMKWHPDRYRGNDKALADRKFREVTEAYNALVKT